VTVVQWSKALCYKVSFCASRMTLERAMAEINVGDDSKASVRKARDQQHLSCDAIFVYS
jgi:hypothetical protein